MPKILSIIKLQITKLPDEISEKLPVKTFKLCLNETIYVNRNLKLGEKLTEIHLQHDPSASDAVQLTNYFLLNNEDLSRQIFYLSNHDGSLYLIKKLNFNLRQTVVFNLTVQVTNMLGQYEFFNINVCLNTKRPQFSSGQQQKYELNIDLSDTRRDYESKMLSLKQAVNTELEDNIYKVDYCYYFSDQVQIAKNFTVLKYPLCSFFEFDKKTASLELKLDPIVKFLLKSSDLMVDNRQKSISFLIDYSVVNSLSSKGDVTRVEIKIIFSGLPNLVVKLENKIEMISEPLEKISFKKNEYYLKITSFEVGLLLLDLSSEVQMVNQIFKPIDFNFTISDMVGFIDIVKNFVVLYVSDTKHNDESFVKLDITCNYLSYTIFTTVFIEIVVQNNDLEWTLRSVNAYLDENSPIMSLFEAPGHQQLRLTNFISNIRRQQDIIFSFLDPNTQNLFEIDQYIGRIRSKFKTSLNNYTVSVVLCKMDEFCLLNRQNRILNVNIFVKEQMTDEKTLVEVIEARNMLKFGDLLPGMTVFKLKSDIKINIQVEGYIDQQIFGIAELKNGIKHIYLINNSFAGLKNSKFTVFCLISIKIDKK
jgi:hypothetical protein